MNHAEKIKHAVAEFKNVEAKGCKPSLKSIAREHKVDFYNLADALELGRSRWNCNESCETSSSRVDAFLEDIVRICEEWGFSISHEDSGGFIVTDFDGRNLEWLMGSAVQFEVK